jgi:hypothetical protein
LCRKSIRSQKVSHFNLHLPKYQLCRGVKLNGPAKSKLHWYPSPIIGKGCKWGVGALKNTQIQSHTIYYYKEMGVHVLFVVIRFWFDPPPPPANTLSLEGPRKTEFWFGIALAVLFLCDAAPPRSTLFGASWASLGSVRHK